MAGQRRQSLVQTIERALTLLEYFGLQPTADMKGKPLNQTVVDDAPVHDAALYGMFGVHANVTDGRYTCFRAPSAAENTPLSKYKHMRTHMLHTFSVEEMRRMTMADLFDFTKGYPVTRIPMPPAYRQGNPRMTHNWLFDTRPHQNEPLDAARSREADARSPGGPDAGNDNPAQQCERLGL